MSDMVSERVTETFLITADHGPVRHITLNRPAVRNALCAPLIEELTAALAAADADAQVGAILLQGAGAGFCAGADLKETGAFDDEAVVRAHAERLRRLLLAPARTAKPIVAHVNGFALGAGCALALACDLCFTTADARFGYPEVRHGVMPALVVPGAVARLGRASAFDLLTSARLFDGREAAARGLAVLAEDAAPAAARAAALAATAPGLVGRVKALIHAVDGLPVEAGFDHATAANIAARLSRLAEKGHVHG